MCWLIMICFPLLRMLRFPPPPYSEAEEGWLPLNEPDWVLHSLRKESDPGRSFLRMDLEFRLRDIRLKA
jgi:hypothetical protein